MAVSRFERFFRAAAAVDVDKDDLKRYNDFLDRKLRDLLIAAQANATANHRDIIQASDFPLTVGLRKSIQEFKRLNEEIEVQPILDQLARHPADMVLSDEAEEELPRLVGAISLALARTFKIIDPKLTNPSSRHWEQAFQIFDLLL